eukprot:CAMPEP_0185906696 /NCGR_PEP_ID=MMETSP0196C-20130402/5816_1 /TAXON_ID=2932 /ORGANISM="Alexandrium fundyense, Strain CCMP1719" /LENGTH=91 /DNA_ID=CAMNT_0028626499 /DNA_START=68 /DNA_END=343 /DNA_ORIENTATION=-
MTMYEHGPSTNASIILMQGSHRLTLFKMSTSHITASLTSSSTMSTVSSFTFMRWSMIFTASSPWSPCRAWRTVYTWAKAPTPSFFPIMYFV